MKETLLAIVVFLLATNLVGCGGGGSGANEVTDSDSSYAVFVSTY